MINEMQQQLHVAEEQSRQDRIKRARDAFWGRFPDALLPTKDDPEAQDNVKINLCRLVVVKSVGYLFGFDLQFQVGEEAESEEDAWLRECWDHNSRMLRLHRLGIHGGIGGDAFVMVLPPNPALYGHDFPRLVLWPADDVLVIPDPEDYERAVRYIRTWHGMDPQTAKPVAFRKVVEWDGAGWQIIDEKSQGQSSAWVETYRERWPYDFCPVFHCQNLPAPDTFYGLADLEPDLIDVNEAINFTLSNTRRIYRIHGHPQTWGKGFGQTEIRRDPSKVLVLESDKGELANLEMQGDPTAGLAVQKNLTEAFHEVARIPEVASGKVEDIGQLSGLALQILYAPLIELTQTKRLTYGDLLFRLNRALLQMRQRTAKPQIVKPIWPSIIPSDRKTDVETAVLENTLGVSKDTLLSGLGRDPEVEAKKIKKERKSDLEVAQRAQKDFAAGRDGALNEDDDAEA